MNAKTLMLLTQQQREWLWVRYVELFPPCENDTEAFRRCGRNWSVTEAAVKQRVIEWRKTSQFAEAEEELREGLSLEAAIAVVEHYYAAGGVLAVQELVKLVQLPWWDGEGKLLGSVVVDAKAKAIQTLLALINGQKRPPRKKDVAASDMIADVADLTRLNTGR